MRTVYKIFRLMGCWLLVFTAQAQKNTVADLKGSTSFACNFFGNSVTYNPPPASAVTDDKAEVWMRGMISQITSITGLQNRFLLHPMKGYNNCAALCVNNNIGQDRYIEFDRDFLEKYQAITKDKWFVVGVVAHEIGHHLNGHSVTGFGSRPEKELEADEFAGFILQKLGASLTDAQNVFSFLNETEGPPSHPVKKKRYLAVKRGWDKASGIVSFASLSFNEADDKDFAVRNLMKARVCYNVNDKIKYLNEALALFPDYAEALSEKGIAFIHKGNLDSAAFFTDKALETEPYIGLLHLNKAKVLYAAKKTAEARTELGLALDYKPILPAAYLFLAQLAFDKKDYNDALLENEIGLRMAPETNMLKADLLSGKAIALYNLGYFKPAFEALSAAKETDPFNVRVIVLYEEYKKKAGV